MGNNRKSLLQGKSIQRIIKKYFEIFLKINWSVVYAAWMDRLFKVREE